MRATIPFLRALFSQVLLFTALLLPGRVLLADGFLDPQKAFQLEAELGAGRQVVLRWEIAKGYKLYRQSVKVTAPGAASAIGTPLLPQGIVTNDPASGEELEIYHDRLTVRVPLVAADKAFTLNVEYQGCSEAGLCYPPFTRRFLVDPAKPGPMADDGPASSSVSAGLSTAPAGGSAPMPVDDRSLAHSTLRGGNFWKIALTFLGFGLLLSLTPCILPLVPILSSIILGDGKSSRFRGFLMALAYCAGMSMVYTTLGVLAGLAGEGLAGFMQHPAILVAFSLLLVAMALSMFDLYQLQMPTAHQNRLNQISGHLKGGSFVRVFFMGALSALVVGPCVAAPLAGSLVYISQTKDVVVGGLALFSMAVGMSVPLMMVGVSAGSLLPRAGVWMVGVKHLFGVLLIAVAIWMVSPVLSERAAMIAWGGLAILGALFHGLLDPIPEGKLAVGARFSKALAISLLVLGVLEFVGAATGGGRVLEPLAGLRGSLGIAKGGEESGRTVFTRIRTEAELDEALTGATRPVMLDFYADWCVSCKEMEAITFTDPVVRKLLGGVSILRVDVTANNDNDRALMKRFGVFGPPAIIFFDRQGRELPSARVDGFMRPAEFSGRLRQVAPGEP
ncbi:MAG: protein-disulfide reductase DsbD [Chlorobiaceae bacterium]|nr:protein-disulfide reductase DsbD [Chlorobiaceae bacterium]